MAIVGTSIPMIDGRERVTGRLRYTQDLDVPDALCGRILRSPHAHARIVRIDPSKAERLPGVHAVLTRNDLGPDSGFTPAYGRGPFRDHPILALDRVRFVGEPVAAVAAEDEEIADEALALIDVEYEELPAVFDPVEAMQPGAPLLHAELLGVEEAARKVGINPQPERNVANHSRFEMGDVEQGFAEADLVVEDEFSNPAAQHVCLEPHVVIAEMKSRDRATVWSGTQGPWGNRATLAGILNVPPENVRIIVSALGGGYGGKGDTFCEPLATLLSWKAGGRPVRIELKRQEEFVTVIRHASRVWIKTGLKRDGTIVARQSKVYWAAGAFSDNSSNVARAAGAGSTGPYRIPNLRIDSYAVYTNHPNAGAFRGYGVPQAAWASEQQLDRVARALGRDPVDLRMQNLMVDGDVFATGEVMHDVHWKEMLESVAEKIEWGLGVGDPDPRSPTADPRPVTPNPEHLRYGKGVAVTWKVTATPSRSDAVVRLTADGWCEVLTSTVEMGQGVRTAMSQMAADAVGVPIDRIRFYDPDTAVTPYDFISAGSRATTCTGGAIRAAAEKVRRQLFELAAQVLEANPADLRLEDGRVFVAGSRQASLPFEEVLRRHGKEQIQDHAEFWVRGGIDPVTGKGVISHHWHQGVGAAEVEVDTETGRVRVLRYQAASWAGSLVNPNLARLQNEGNVIFGLGQTLFEEMLFDQGRVLNPNLTDYLIPSFVDLPGELAGESLVSGDPEADVHGIGESTIPPVSAAVGNAIYAATGVQMHDLPLKPERVLRALSEVQP